MWMNVRMEVIKEELKCRGDGILYERDVLLLQREATPKAPREVQTFADVKRLWSPNKHKGALAKYTLKTVPREGGAGIQTHNFEVDVLTTKPPSCLS